MSGQSPRTGVGSMSATRSGGCLCGAVRYEAAWPPLALVVCHCRNCQKQSGSALSVVAMVARNGLNVTGEMAMFEDRGRSEEHTSEIQSIMRKQYAAFCLKK